MDLSIKELAVHILDNTLGIPVLSKKLHPLSAETNEFVGKHIEKMFSNKHLKSSRFMDEAGVIGQACMALKEDMGQFLPLTKLLAESVYEQMLQHTDIPSADLVFSLMLINETPFLVMLKLNYQASFVHHVEEKQGDTINSIIKQQTTLPSYAQKLDEAVAIDLSTLDIFLLEKMYNLDGAKDFYLSPRVLNCEVNLSGHDKLKIVERTAEAVIEKYYGHDDMGRILDFKRVVNEQIEEDQAVDISQVAQRVFGNIEQVARGFNDALSGLGEKISVDHQASEDYYKQQRIVTDTGFEIKVPIGASNDLGKVQFNANQDGSMDIVVKNIRHLRK